jgi:hypothetical protein
VARLGEFSPNDNCFFTLGSFFLKIAEVAHIFWLPFSTVKVMH